MTVQNFEGT